MSPREGVRRRQTGGNKGYFTKKRATSATHSVQSMTLTSSERAILFADVSGSTALYEKLGDRPAARAIEACLDELRAVVAKWEGKVVKTIGDELMVVFDRPEAASAAAREMQSRVTALPSTGGVNLAIRIGFHFGPVLEDKGDFLGDGVNTAARLAGLAKGGQILTSGATVNTLSITQRDLDTIPVKGKQEAVRVFELLWGDTEDATQLAGLASSARIEARLTLEIGERTVDFPREKAALTLGREASCDVVVAEKTASR